MPATLAYTGLVSDNFLNHYDWWNFQSNYYAVPTSHDDLCFVGTPESGDSVK